MPSRPGFINITPQVDTCLRESGIREGLRLVNSMHITSSVSINDDERGLYADYEDWSEELAPHQPISRYRHNPTGQARPERSRRDNGDAHLKRQIMGREVVVAITDGWFDFGPWEQIFGASHSGWHASLDGRRWQTKSPKKLYASGFIAW